MQCLLVDEVHFFNRYRAVLSELDVCTHLCDNCMLSSELFFFYHKRFHRRSKVPALSWFVPFEELSLHFKNVICNPCKPFLHPKHERRVLRVLVVM